MDLDLDARRTEYENESHDVTLGGQAWTLPAKFPLIAAQYLTAGQIESAVRVLFGAEAVPIVGPLINDDDLNTILSDLYDLEPEATPGRQVIEASSTTNGRNRAQRRAVKS